MEGQHISTEAVIDNGTFGKRTIRFETGRLARQAAGSAVAYLDDETMILSATTASKTPKEHLDFFPLTVDVEERMYAAGKIPGSFFRREGRPSEDAILTCRLTDRPLRPSFAKGLRNEIQIVMTIMALHPEHLYDVVAINAASASTQLANLPFSGPIGATRVAHIEGQWVAFPTHLELERATFDMVVAGRMLADGDVAIMMVEAEATDQTINLIAGGAPAPTEEVVAQGLEAAKPFIRVLCEAQQQLADAAKAADPRPAREYPRFLDYGDDLFAAVEDAVGTELAAALRIAGKQEREDELDRLKGVVTEQVGGQVRGSREGDLGGAALAHQEAGPPAGRGRRRPDRRPGPHRYPRPVCRGRGAPAGARLGAVRARRDPDPGRHDAEHAADGAAARHVVAGDAQALHAPLQLPAVLHR